MQLGDLVVRVGLALQETEWVGVREGLQTRVSEGLCVAVTVDRVGVPVGLGGVSVRVMDVGVRLPEAVRDHVSEGLAV